MAQSYTAHFFELPGHGRSTPLSEGYSLDGVASATRDLLDALGIERVTLMGFSFGGLLALRALQLLGDRVDRVILLSPCVSRHGLLRPPLKLAALKGGIAALRTRALRSLAARAVSSESGVAPIAWFMEEVGGFETAVDLKERLRSFTPSTIDVLTRQIRDILTISEQDLSGSYPQRCFFGMSVRDPLLDFETSRAFVEANFSDAHVERFDFPYHTPPEPFTYERLNADYRSLLDAFS